MSTFTPELWHNHIMGSLQYSSYFASPPLDRHDLWAPTGETFEEAVAWALLAGVQVTKSSSTRMEGLASTLRISKPGRFAAVIPLCSPTELIKHIKDYAEGNMDMAAATESLSGIIINHRK